MTERLRTPPKQAPRALAVPKMPPGRWLKPTREAWASWFTSGLASSWNDAQLAEARNLVRLIDDRERAEDPDERAKRQQAVRLAGRPLGLTKPAAKVEERAEVPPGDYRRPDIDPRDGFAPSMMTPAHDGAATLGPQVVAWIEHSLIFGQGNLHGEPARVDRDKAAIVWRAYELRPDGRRRFQRVCVSWRKGWGKSEALIGWVGAAELHPDAPVRFSHWAAADEPPSAWGYRYAEGEPVSVGVNDPMAFVMASTEAQAEQVGYGTLRAILLESPAVRDDFDIGLERTTRVNGTGFVTAISTAPNPADGRLTTWVALDETGRLTRHEDTHRAVLGNLSKRVDSWCVETSTAPAPDEGSIAERTRQYADLVATGEIADPSLLYVHNQARADHPLDTERDVEDALIEASGPCMAEWANIPGALALWADPNHDRGYFRRMQLNQSGVYDSDRVFDFEVTLCRRPRLARRQEITAGFDGSLTEDSTVLAAQVLRTGEQFAYRMWERPAGAEPGWSVPRDEVDAAVEELFRDYRLELLLCDPHYWRPTIAKWEGAHNSRKRYVDVFDTRTAAFIDALAAYRADLRSGAVRLANEPRLLAHFANSRKDYKAGGLDSEGEQRFTLKKETRALKIDGAVACTLAHVAARVVVAAGRTKSYGSKPGRSAVYCP